MAWIVPLIGAAASIGGGLMGEAAAEKNRKAALAAGGSALQNWLDVHIPSYEEQKVFLKNYVQTGKITPEIESALKQEASNYDKVQVDPRLKESQLKALSSLEQLGHGGLSLWDKAGIQDALINNASSARGRQESIADNFGHRGLGGSGLELVSQLQNAQNATTNDAQARLGTLGSARDRALQAIIQGGNMAGSIRNQSFNEQSEAAKAKDAINEFNARNAQSVAQRNADRNNAAQEYNLGLQQKVSDQNVGIANQQEIANKGLSQQQFNNQSAKAKGLSGQYDTYAAAQNAAGQREADKYVGIGNAVAGTVGQIGASQNNNSNSFMNDYFKKQNGYTYVNPNDEEYKKGYLNS